MASHDAPLHADQGLSVSHTRDSMFVRDAYGYADVVGGRDALRDTDVRGGRERGNSGPRMSSKAGQGRRHRGYKQLFQKVMRGERDTLDTDGRM